MSAAVANSSALNVRPNDRSQPSAGAPHRPQLTPRTAAYLLMSRPWESSLNAQVWPATAATMCSAMISAVCRPALWPPRTAFGPHAVHVQLDRLVTINAFDSLQIFQSWLLHHVIISEHQYQFAESPCQRRYIASP